MSKLSGTPFIQRTRPRSTFLLAEPPQQNSGGSMSLRKRTSRLMTTLPVASSTPSSSQPPSPSLTVPLCQCCGGAHSKSLFELMEPRPLAPELAKDLRSAAPKPETNIHYDCERKIRDLNQQLADAIDLAYKLRQCVQIPKPNESDSHEQSPQDISSRSSYAITVTDTNSKDTQLDDDVPDEDWGFCYVDDGGRVLDGVVEESDGQDQSLFASRSGYTKPMTAQKRNRLSAVIGDNMLYLSELPVSEESPTGSSPGPSPGSSMSSWTTDSDKDVEPITPKPDAIKYIPTAVWHSSGSRKTREEPSERAMSCDISPRENRTFDNPLGGRHGYINRKFRTNQMVGRSSVAAYRA